MILRIVRLTAVIHVHHSSCGRQPGEAGERAQDFHDALLPNNIPVDFFVDVQGDPVLLSENVCGQPGAVYDPDHHLHFPDSFQSHSCLLLNSGCESPEGNKLNRIQNQGLREPRADSS